MKRIKQFPNYSVTEDGRVYSHNRNKFLCASDDGNGYLKVCVRKDGKSYAPKVHKLVAMAYLGHEPKGMKEVVDHINGNKLDNRLENLQLTTNRHNTSKDRKGHTSSYLGVSWSKKNKKWVAQIYKNKKQNFIGAFNCEMAAAKAYNDELNKLKNEHK